MVFAALSSVVFVVFPSVDVLFPSVVFVVSSSAGTFPIETVPNIFRFISPFMPATYTIKMFKESLITLDMNLFMNSFIIIFIIAIVFFGINFYHSYKLDKENK